RQAPPLRCEGAFAPGVSAADLVGRFGAENVRNTSVYVGEGTYEPGTVLFPGSKSSVRIIWKDAKGQRNPDSIRVAARNTTLTSYFEIGLGTDLQAVEKFNGKPFTLHGFGWDYSGTVASWEGGELDRATGGDCTLLLRFAPRGTGIALDGSEIFSSHHPEMWNLNPEVYDLLLVYP
ncbi:MAG TPA: hypothetical protein VFV54_05925, partial [Thermoanaerobaculia bacterium]|nr:hypothetical protein [Thermoanaerobaculia bacterium]